MKIIERGNYMVDFKTKDYKVFEMFEKQWAIVTAGSMDHYNCCTIGWGSLGNIWSHSNKSISTVTVYVHPDRYTCGFLKDSDTFTVSFYPEEYRKAVAYIGTHSGRDEDKVTKSGLIPISFGEGVTFKQANLTFLCKKLYQHQFDREDLASEIQEYYASAASKFPDGKGGWQPHYVFVGEIIDVLDDRQ